MPPEFHSSIPCPPIPDDLTVAQFMLDEHNPRRPIRSGNTPWLIEDGTARHVGFEEIRFRTHGLANAMHRRWGVGKDDVVCIYSPNHVDYPVAIWAAHRLGATVSCANPAYNTEELAYQLIITKALVLVSHSDSLTTALAAARESGVAADHIFLIDELKYSNPIPYSTIPNLVKEGLSMPLSFKELALSPGEGRTKVAFLSFSSGTTGKPKAVALSHYAVLANILQLATSSKLNEDYTSSDKCRYRPGDIALGVLPFYHIYGLAVILHSLLFAGLTLVVVPKFSFESFLKCTARYKITHLFLVPPQIVLLCKHPLASKYDFSHIRFCLSGAAPLSKELTQQLIKRLPNAEIGQGYGMTESAISHLPLGQRIGTPGSVGQLAPGCVARIRKPDGSLGDYEEEGELEVTGPQLALRYTNDEKATQETFADGWLRTGDQVKFAKNGDIFILDRLKEIIKVRGFQVAPAELEGHLLEHPKVADACVVGIPDDYSGELPFAFIVLVPRAAARAKNNATESERIKQSIMKHVSDAKINYKWLQGGLEFIDSVPKSPSGKILRRQMRDRVQEVVGKRSMKSKL